MKHRALLLLIAALYIAVSVSGITWGLPSRSIDRYLFGDDEPWSGEKIARLAGAARKDSASLGADVDVDPLRKSGGEPIPMTDTDEKVAAIYLRYRLYTYQPDEMITMMALSGMRPSSFDFDPRLYQYGGLFIYPVGALIKACGVVGLIDVRSDLTYYLDNPDEFGKFYVAARAYVVAWGLVGLFVVYAITTRLAGLGPNRAWAGLLAGLLYTLLPVVVCMSHEAKPHLPGAVLMLLAVFFAMRYNETDCRRDWWLTCVACGAALGMVLSSLPILALIPLVQFQRYYDKIVRPGKCVKTAIAGMVLAMGIYALTNPYVLINLFANREVLASNFGNSMAMYEVSRLGAGFLRMLVLTSEGATFPVLVLGAIGLFVIMRGRIIAAIPLVTIAVLIFVQFTLIGAGKPAEYGRFGLFNDVVLAIVTAAGMTLGQLYRRRNWHYLFCILAMLWCANEGYGYLNGMLADAGPDNSRLRAARLLHETRIKDIGDPATPLMQSTSDVALTAEPAPYCCPPLNFAGRSVVLVRNPAQMKGLLGEERGHIVFLTTLDFRSDAHRWEINVPSYRAPYYRNWIRIAATWNTEISWANKPVLLLAFCPLQPKAPPLQSPGRGTDGTP